MSEAKQSALANLTSPSPQAAATGATGGVHTSVAPKESGGQPPAGASKPATAAPKPSDVADRKRCEDQAWPYLDQRCLANAQNDSAAPSRDIRIVSTDNVTAPSNAAASPAQDSASAKTAGAATLQPPAGPSPHETTGAAPPADPQPAQQASTAAMPPPQWNARSAPQASTPNAPPPLQPAAQQPAPQPAAQQPTPQPAPQQSASRSDDPRLAPRARPGTRSVQTRAHRPQWSDDDRHFGDNRSYRDNRRVNPRGQRDRSVVLSHSYRLPNGRLVTVRRVYRNLPTREDIEEAELGRRSVGRYYTLAPSGAFEDDD
jgi:hypothetical protein